MGSNTQTGNQARTADNNLRISSFVAVGSSAQSLTLHQSPINDQAKWDSELVLGSEVANSSTTRFTFSKPVYDLTFWLIDIDSIYYDFLDGVAVEALAGPMGTPVLGFTSRGSLVSGSGTRADPFRSTGRNNDINAQAADGDMRASVKLVFSGPPLTTFDLRYQNRTAYADDQVDGDQAAYLGPFTFTYYSC